MKLCFTCRFPYLTVLSLAALVCLGPVRNAFSAGEVVAKDLPSALPVTGREIALVFDDGPLPQTTPLILDALKKAGMHASFSVVGSHVMENPEITRRIVAEGHEVVNQTFSHADPDAMSAEEFLNDVRRAQSAIEQVAGVQPKLFRPPMGSLRPDLAAMIEEEGYRILEPTLDSGDWRSPPPGEVRRVILSGVTPGCVILAHDSFPKSVAEMPSIIEELSRRGFQSLTVSELRMRAFARN